MKIHKKLAALMAGVMLAVPALAGAAPIGLSLNNPVPVKSVNKVAADAPASWTHATFTVNTQTGAVDTTEAIKTTLLPNIADLVASGVNNGANLVVGKLVVWSGTTAWQGDSIYAAIDCSVDGRNWEQNQGMTALSVVSGGKFGGMPLTIDTDAATSAAGGWVFYPYIRFRIRGSANAGASIPADVQAAIFAFK